MLNNKILNAATIIILSSKLGFAKNDHTPDHTPVQIQPSSYLETSKISASDYEHRGDKPKIPPDDHLTDQFKKTESIPKMFEKTESIPKIEESPLKKKSLTKKEISQKKKKKSEPLIKNFKPIYVDDQKELSSELKSNKGNIEQQIKANSTSLYNTKISNEGVKCQKESSTAGASSSTNSGYCTVGAGGSNIAEIMAQAKRTNKPKASSTPGSNISDISELNKVFDKINYKL